MSRLEEITVGSTVKGILGGEPVTIVAVQWYGTAVLDVTYKDSHGTPCVTMLMREEEQPGSSIKGFLCLANGR